jgi:NodT family efflux transporter outer membrane factor (OMF) lipoprotein
MKHSLWLIPLASLLLSGCSAFSVPWQNKEPVVISSEPQVSQSSWWSDFNDPLIDLFANKLQTQNIDIQIAEARLAEARAMKIVSRSGFFPDLSVSASGARGNTSSPKSETLGQAGFDASWELDVFGRTRAGVDAAEARRLASLASVNDAKNIVTAELVRTVIEWRQAKQTTKEINDLLKAQDDQVSLLESRVKAGLIDASFLERARAQRAQTAAGLPDSEAAANAAQYQIERLLAVRDETVQIALTQANPKIMNIPRVEDALSITLESVRERPDVRQARAGLLAAQADLKQAEADLWPRVTLSSFFGVQDGGDGLRLAENPVWSLASAVTLPLLNFGRLRGMVDAADARAKQASLRYEDIVNRALQETKTALSDYLNGMNSISAQESALKSRQDTIRIAKERFERGLTDMTDLTTAQAELDTATIALINIKTETAIAYIRLQKSLKSNF